MQDVAYGRPLSVITTAESLPKGMHVDLCASRAAVFPSFFGQSERILCVIYSIKFYLQILPFTILYH